MDLQNLKETFLRFYSNKGYKKLPPSSLLPENDPTVLFTTAGMQQFKDNFLYPDAKSKSIVTIQPVIRTSDITEVGDDTHFTMFEMLGNFIFGGESSKEIKERAIEEAWQFINKELKVDRSRISITYFKGEGDLPEDEESRDIWKQYGVDVKGESKKDNFWGPTGDSGPCGPTTEIYIDGIEVWNLVFNEYKQTSDGKFEKLEKVGLDTGAGLARLVATLDKKKSVWDVEPFMSVVKKVGLDKNKSRIIIDHLQALLFITSENVLPGNKGRDYVCRRLMRKVIFFTRGENIPFDEIIDEIISFYGAYPLIDRVKFIQIYEKEKNQFEKNINTSLIYIDKWLKSNEKPNKDEISSLAFNMYGSYGFPRELVIDYLAEKGHEVDQKYFDVLFSKHQEVSRQGLEKQFKGGLADSDPKTVKHHTAHHLLLAALRKVLGNDVFQRGSNVNSERLRLDFSFPEKLSIDQLSDVESLVNDWINQDLPVKVEEMDKEKALKSGAQAEFGQKYGDIVTVYYIDDVSMELCGGPHVSRTGELGHFSILKEESVAQGIRRIKAKVE